MRPARAQITRGTAAGFPSGWHIFNRAMLAAAIAIMATWGYSPVPVPLPGPASVGSVHTDDPPLVTAGETADSDPSDNECSVDNPQLIPGSPLAIRSLHSELVWPITTGEGIIVAIVDSGVSAENPHLREPGLLLAGTNLLNDDQHAEGWADLDSHGTAIAGIIAAHPIPGSGVQGFAPGVSILPVRVFRDRSEEAYDQQVGPKAETMADGIRWAADYGAEIINVSLSDPVDSPYLRAAVEHAEIMGSLVVASAGNANTAESAIDGARYPAAYPTVLGVAAANQNFVVDDASIHGPQVDVSAPGMNILTTYYGVGDCEFSTQAASSSWATAYVSAAAALVASKFRAEDPAGWRYRLMATASRAVPDARDDVSGWGQIQPYEALTMVDDGSIPGPESPFHPRPKVSSPPAQQLDLSTTASPLAPTQQIAVMLGIVAGAALIGLLLVARLRHRDD